MSYGLLLFCDSKHVLTPEAGVKHTSQILGHLSTAKVEGVSLVNGAAYV